MVDYFQWNAGNEHNFQGDPITIASSCDVVNIVDDECFFYLFYDSLDVSKFVCKYHVYHEENYYYFPEEDCAPILKDY